MISLQSHCDSNVNRESTNRWLEDESRASRIDIGAVVRMRNATRTRFFLAVVREGNAATWT